jgi:hypothetical protein
MPEWMKGLIRLLVNLRARNVAYSMLFVTSSGWGGLLPGPFNGRGPEAEVREEFTASGRSVRASKGCARCTGVREASSVTLRDVRHGLFSSKRGMGARYLLLTDLS